MAMPLNIFEENWIKNMNLKFEKAKGNRTEYESFIDSLERRFDANPDDRRVKGYVAKLRQILWPEDQVEKNSSLLEVIPKKPSETKETFERLKTEDNYKKVAAYFSRIAKGPAPAA